jgi:hypothetical protein
MSDVYKARRTINTAKAIVKGPKSMAKRAVRIAGFRSTASILNRLLK